MKFEKLGYKDDWIGVRIGLSKNDISKLVDYLKILEREKGHFHLTSGFEGNSKVGDVEFYFDSEEDKHLKFL